MSTRACIAFGNSITDFHGRYHHSDGYPSGLGRELYTLAQQWDAKKMEKMLYKDHPAGWSCIIDSNWDAAPGYRNAYACDLCGVRMFDHPEHATAPVRHAFAIGPRCYCHGDRKESGWSVRPEHMADTDMRWFYLISGRTMFVHKIKPFGKGGIVPTPVAVVDLDATEPDWDAMEAVTAEAVR